MKRQDLLAVIVVVGVFVLVALDKVAWEAAVTLVAGLVIPTSVGDKVQEKMNRGE
jgi:uncharacterized membrane protein YfcA